MHGRKVVMVFQPVLKILSVYERLKDHANHVDRAYEEPL